MNKIFVKSQKELDLVPTEDNVIINICFGTQVKPAYISKKYNNSVKVCNNSIAVAIGNSSVAACDNSIVLACEHSFVRTFDDSSVIACGDSVVVAYNNSIVVAYNNKSVRAYDNSSVEAYGDSMVIACDNSSVEAYGNTQVLKRDNHRNNISIFGNARIVYTPKNIIDFMEYHNINHDNDIAIFYKAVHKKITANRIEYFSHFDSNFTYEIGKKQNVDFCNRNPKEECAEGIHISTKYFALIFGMDWDDLAILEVKAKIGDIVVPDSNDGKVRVSEVEVIREVPLKECGLLGKVFSRRNRMKKGDQNE